MLKKTDNIISLDLNKIKKCNINCINIILLFITLSLCIPVALICIYYLFNIISFIFSGIYLIFTSLNLLQIFLCSILYINSFIIILYYINVNYNKEFSKYKKYRNRIKLYGRKLYNSNYFYRDSNPIHIMDDRILIGMRIIFMLSIPFFLSFSTSTEDVSMVLVFHLIYSIIHGFFRCSFEIKRLINYIL